MREIVKDPEQDLKNCRPHLGQSSWSNNKESIKNTKARLTSVKKHLDDPQDADVWTKIQQSCFCMTLKEIWKESAKFLRSNVKDAWWQFPAGTLLALRVNYSFIKCVWGPKESAANVLDPDATKTHLEACGVPASKGQNEDRGNLLVLPLGLVLHFTFFSTFLIQLGLINKGHNSSAQLRSWVWEKAFNHVQHAYQVCSSQGQPIKKALTKWPAELLNLKAAARLNKQQPPATTRILWLWGTFA